jgi:hypothetical protein
LLGEWEAPKPPAASITLMRDLAGNDTVQTAHVFRIVRPEKVVLELFFNAEFDKFMLRLGSTQKHLRNVFPGKGGYPMTFVMAGPIAEASWNASFSVSSCCPRSIAWRSTFPAVPDASLEIPTNDVKNSHGTEIDLSLADAEIVMNFSLYHVNRSFCVEQILASLYC